MNIYVVMGSTGEYSDNSRWSVIAYFDETKAKEHVVKADSRAKEIFIENQDNIWNVPSGLNEFDPDMSMDYTGTVYYYLTVAIGDTLP